MHPDQVIFTLRDVGSDFYSIQTNVPGLIFKWPLLGLKLAMEYPYWHAKQNGVVVSIEIRDCEGNLIETKTTAD